tara:strand:+ start:4540 stop:4776 length:237 start_codon:yes stop_codon:yes gene_type:complete
MSRVKVAGHGPEDLQMVELPDRLSANELLTCEAGQAQCTELVRQLRGDTQNRQTAAKHGLQHNSGPDGAYVETLYSKD